jgi:phosphatidylserine/phosphatidylglycerophosphate/cardiolipin synthase-like enzyme
VAVLPLKFIRLWRKEFAWDRIEGEMTKRYLVLFVLFALLVPTLLVLQKGHADKIIPNQNTNDIEVFFSPKGGCTDAIIKELANAKTGIRIQAYSFTSAPIAKAVVDANKNGIDTKVILDKSQRTERYSSADFLAHAGVSVLIDARHKIAHNKIMIIDSNSVITGSFNFTKSAEEENAENLLIIRNAELAAKYLANWNIHSRHSEPYFRQITLKRY